MTFHCFLNNRYFPTPSPRKSIIPQNQPQNQPQQEYMNVPRRQSGQMSKRAESVTPMVAAASGLLDNDSSSIGEFKRSSSARLHRNKRNNPEMFQMLDENKKREQREESMKRLLEWKQRMLQSPLTRKSSRNASRTQTPTNSDSPIPSFLLEKKDSKMNNGRPQPQMQPIEANKRVSRKGSTASRSSRSRSSPRVSQRLDMSSSDEG